MFFKNKNVKRKESSNDLEALLMSSSDTEQNNDTHIVSLKRREKLKQQERHGRARLVFLVLAVVSIIYLSFITNSHPYQNMVVVIPTDPYNGLETDNTLTQDKSKLTNTMTGNSLHQTTNHDSSRTQTTKNTKAILHTTSDKIDIVSLNYENYNFTSTVDVVISLPTQIPLLHHNNSPANALTPSQQPTTLLLVANNVTSSSQPSPPPKTIGNASKSAMQKINSSTASATSTTISKSLQYNQTVPHGYLVYGPHCKIPAIDPLAKDAMKVFHHEEFKPCSKQPALTYVEQDWKKDEAILYLNFSAVHSYVSSKSEYLECCYQEVHRNNTSKTHPDNHYDLTSCRSFDKNVTLPKDVDSIIVKCSRITKSKPHTVYTDGHALIRKKPEVMMRFTDNFITPNTTNTKHNRTFTDDSPVETENKTRPLSVLLIGIDSISRINLIRSMPHTAQHLYDTGWLELKGYNKMGDNTFPNLMAILTGMNLTDSIETCQPTLVGRLDECPLVWKDYQEAGYVTAYAEDEAKIGTFNYNKKGFTASPVDHYFRPFGLAAEKSIKGRMEHGLKMCLGYRHYGEYIFKYALDFALQYKNKPYFGLFWTNTFSHNDISTASAMDQRVKEFIVTLKEQGVLDESLVIFFSDHGMRFGRIRELLTGWFEERLPFVFFSFPPWFREAYPDLVENFQTNRNRLTTPYDFHITLKHILNITASAKTNATSRACPNCQSLLEEVSNNRSCADAAIDQHWCTCIPFADTDKSSKKVKEAIAFTINLINKDVLGYKPKNATKSPCAKLELRSIVSAKTAIDETTKNTLYIVIFKVNPSQAELEATVIYDKSVKKFNLTGTISRLNAYAGQDGCVDIDWLKKYCYCKKKN